MKRKERGNKRWSNMVGGMGSGSGNRKSGALNPEYG